MKFAFLVAAAMLAGAEDDPGRSDPQAELLAMASCTATEMAIMHGYTQSAAIINALSANSQLDQIKQSYQRLAVESQKRVVQYATIIDDMLIPQVAQTLGAKPEDV